ncbi:class I SAM-dependent rRNA methyltransferase [Raineya orbicola]|jgi:23S rRNA (cytosine1962-C5)-methyltransferase|uniref:Putative SAM-dependent methyltransferase n=1 Tax=Raineya orbicola TaxID=2016530 RepID=A0A2N3IJH1_9BACT|nr:class I SAM-dependent rRNA methyltransferase [Raineya orbicola]PKQ70457.1 putative SAM-dependent methyltransferase [Raineya orbicola]
MENLVLKSGRERSVEHQHAWIYSGAIKEFPKKAEQGDIVKVVDNKQNFLGYGFYAPKNQIACRMFYFGKKEIELRENFWKEKIWKAYELRKKYVISQDTNAYRLLFSEGDGLPGVIVDVYDQVASVQILHKGIEKIYHILIQALREIGLEYIYLKTKENSRRLEQIDIPEGWVDNVIPQEKTIISENGLLFGVDVEKGQKTGFFLDQRENRALLKSYAKGKRVLNTFSYTGGFSVYAAAGEAEEVISVDISKEVCAEAEKNMQMNFPNYRKHQAFAEDCFLYLKKIPENYYDLIVLDPPAFAKTAQNVPNAARGYKEINMQAFKKIQSGGLVFTFSCSGSVDRDLFRKIVFGAAADVGRDIKILHQLTQPPDHPISIYHPESEYLKGLVLYVS